MRFKGKISWWFYAIMLIIAAVLVPLIIVSAFVDPSAAALAVCLLVFLATEAFCASIVFRNYVELEKDGLLIVFGFIRKRIPYGGIRKVAETEDFSSSLAASLDRIAIQYGDGADVMIAVRDKAGFFRELEKRRREQNERAKEGK